MKLLYKSKLTWLVLVLVALLLLALAGCSGSANTSSASSAIEAYLQALVNKDANQVANFSCAAWESQSKVELDSFAAVTATLEEPACRETGQEGEFTLVSCSGKILASYNGENQEINLGDRTYKAVKEGGEWRMCGYR